MVEFQIWLTRTLARAGLVLGETMRTAWAWPLAESVHFIGLCLLVGAIFLFDLRLLGMGRRIPIGALHKLVPWGLLGFGLTVFTGLLFLVTEPNQYVYNPAFHWKMIFMITAGLNASAFYLTSYRRTTALAAPDDAPPLAKIIAVVSISLWIGVITSGRLLTFYRPTPCNPGEGTRIATCLPNYPR